MLKIAEYTRKIDELKQKAQTAFQNMGLSLMMPDSNDNAIRLVFAGQYSAGKSSILKMLTGREDIAIGAGITTQRVHTYQWNGIEVVDTPGIHTEKRPDHDELSYEAIASADMLVFVITNEMFDSHLAEHFRKLAIEKDKAGEMILVVNKMDRASDGNTHEQQQIIRDDLCKVLEPYTPEQMNLCFLDAESFLDAVDEDDSEVASELVNRSGYAEFINTLNSFVSAKRIPAKLTTGLYMLEEQLHKAVADLEPQNTDSDVEALEENLMQRRHELIERRGRLQDEVKDVFLRAASQIREIGLDAANLLTEGCNQSEIETELEKAVRKADGIIEESQAEAFRTVESRFSEMGTAIDSIDESDFTCKLKTKLEGRFNVLPENVKKIIGNATPGLQKAGQSLAINAYKPGVNGGLKLSNFSGSKVHNLVLKVGHTVKYKFKPWQAIKITKGVAIGGKVLGVLGVGLSVFMQIKTDQDQERMQIDLRNNRQNIRSQFNCAANGLEDYGHQYIQDNVILTLAAPISELDQNLREIRENRANKSAACRNMEMLESECQRLIQDIHAL